VLQEGHLEDPPEAEEWGPEPALQVPVGFWEVPGGESLAFLEDQDGISLLGQAKGGYASSESGADDDPVPAFFDQGSAQGRRSQVSTSQAKPMTTNSPTSRGWTFWRPFFPWNQAMTPETATAQM
jgi:hypothetical protein